MRFMVLTRAKNQPGADGVIGTPDDVQNADQHRLAVGRPVPDLHLARRPTRRSCASTPPTRAGDRSPPARCSGRRGSPLTPVRRRHVHLGLDEGAGRDPPRPAAHRQGRARTSRCSPSTPTATSSPDRPAACRSTSPRPGWSRATPRTRSRCRSDVQYFDTPFLTDIAHNADPSPPDTTTTRPSRRWRRPRTRTAPRRPTSPCQPPGTYDDEMLDAHFIAGDGRVNENIGLTAIHQVFHSEHDRLVDDIKDVLATDTSAKRRRRSRRAGKSADGAGRAGTASGCSRRPLRHRDGVPAPGLRGVRAQGAAGDQPLRALRLHPDRPQPGHPRGVRPRGLPVRALDAHRDHLAARNAGRQRHDDISLLDGFLNPPAYSDGGAAGTLHARCRPPAASSWA